MSGIFLSYRRTDTEAWAGRLFDGLRRRFGASQIFMDIKGGISRGANFEQALKDALSGCDAMMVFIGPTWLTCTRDGVRRLDVPDDWVRQEIAAALERNIPIVPMLVGGAKLPSKEHLPEALHQFLRHEAARIEEASFDYDFEELVKDVKRRTSLRDVGELHHPEAGTILLRKLIYEMPAAADRMSRSAYAAEVTRRQVDELEIYKAAHDLLHQIEADVQRPIKDTRLNAALTRRFRNKFNDLRRRISEETEGQELPGGRAPLLEALQSTTEAFEIVEANYKSPGDVLNQQARHAYEILLGRLEELPTFAMFLDTAISMLKDKLDLDDVVLGLSKVHALMPSGQAAQDPDLTTAIGEFARSVQALRDLHRELDLHVRRHRQFQGLDSLLRMICRGHSAEPATQWKRVKQLRLALPEPLPQAWRDKDMEATEAEIDAAFSKGNDTDARALIDQYFADVSDVFFDVDTDLKKFLNKLKRINPTLDALLAQSETGDRP